MPNVRVSDETHGLLMQFKGYMQMRFKRDFSFDEIINALLKTFLSQVLVKIEEIDLNELGKYVNEEPSK